MDSTSLHKAIENTLFYLAKASELPIKCSMKYNDEDKFKI